MARMVPLLILLLTGCGGVALVKERHVDTVTVTWVRDMSPCPWYANACVRRTPDRSKCWIYMYEDAADHTVAHEFKHCFGYEHAEVPDSSGEHP